MIMISSFSYKRKVSEHMIFVGLSQMQCSPSFDSKCGKQNDPTKATTHNIRVSKKRNVLEVLCQNGSQVWGVGNGKNCEIHL